MKLNIFGLGYVGSVTSICLASVGHDVVGIEVVESKTKALNEGRLPLFEPGLEELFQSVLAKKTPGSFRAVAELPPNGNDQADASIICVGTPSLNCGGVDLSQITETAAIIGKSLKTKNPGHQIIFRSTIPPSTTEELLIPLLERESGKKCGRDFRVCFYPEFLREGHAIKDFFNPSLNLVGATEDESVATIDQIFKVDRKSTRTSVRAAEMIKYANNSFHAVKVAFANEMGTLAKAYGVDSDELMRLFASDTALNLSPYYLRPGFAFGGSCLPKELRSVSSLGTKKNIKTPLLDSILPSNDEHIARLITLIEGIPHDSKEDFRIAFFGATFKPNTDDIRESPIIEVMDKLTRAPSYKKPIVVKLWDQAIVQDKIGKLFGERVKMVTNSADLLKDAQLIVLGPYKPDEAAQAAIAAANCPVIDLKWHKVPENIRNKANFKEIC